MDCGLMGAVLLQFEVGCWTRPYPHVLQLVISTVPIEGWIINPYVYGLLDGPGEVVWFSTHTGEIIQLGLMTCDAGMIINGGRHPQMFLKSFPKGLCRPPMYPSSHPTLSHLYLKMTPLFCVMGVLFLGPTRKLLMVLPSSNYTLMPILLQMFLKLSPLPFT